MDSTKFSFDLDPSALNAMTSYHKLTNEVTTTTATAMDTDTAGSVASNNTLNLLAAKTSRPLSSSASWSIFLSPIRRRRVSHNDSLAQTLTDPSVPAEPLGKFDAWSVDPAELSLGPAFAHGAFGRIYRGTYRGNDVAVKLLENPDGDPDRAAGLEKQFEQEVYMLAVLDHPSVVRFVGACRKKSVWCIMTEYARGGSMREFLAGKREGKGVGARVAVKQALDVARGMEYVHSLGFIHRDLKSDNLLIVGDRSIKIADFGMARIEAKTEGMTPETGTYRWMAPEMIQRRPYNNKVDVYSFGTVLWELITGNLPFQNMTSVQVAFAVVNNGARPPIPSDCHPVLAELMTSCWDSNPDARPSFGEVVKLLENAQMAIGTKARFRCCVVEPKTTG